MEPKEIQALLDKKFESTTAEMEQLKLSGATKEEVANLQAAIDKQSNALEDIAEAMKSRQIESIGAQFKNFLITNKERLQQIKQSGSGILEFVPKVVGDMSTASGGDVAAAPVNHNVSLGSFNFRNDNDLLSLFSVSSTNSASFPYTELLPKDGDFTFVAEGAVKPQIDFTWEIRYSTPKKIAAYEILTEEVADDIDRMVSTAKEYLKTKHDLFKVSGLFFGSGVGEIAKGATLYGRAFVPGAMEFAITNPTFMDAINAAVTDIYTTHNYVDESSYMPNTALISPIDFFLNIQSAKDSQGKPLYPQASLFNSLTIGGMTIRPWAKIPVGKIFVADLKKYNVANYIPYSVRIGWINDQMITNKFTMVGESRFHAYVKKLDEQAFIYDDFATILASIDIANAI